MSCVKTAEPIKMPFGIWTQVGALPREALWGAHWLTTWFSFERTARLWELCVQHSAITVGDVDDKLTVCGTLELTGQHF